VATAGVWGTAALSLWEQDRDKWLAGFSLYEMAATEWLMNQDTDEEGVRDSLHCKTSAH